MSELDLSGPIDWVNGKPQPFKEVWEKVWAGALGLVRYIEENPDIVRGKEILDVATGTGVVAHAAIQAGCHSVTLNDIEMAALLKAAAPLSLPVLNHGDFAEMDPSEYDVVFISEHWYEEGLYKKTLDWIRRHDPELVITASIRRDKGEEMLRLKEPDFEHKVKYAVEPEPGTESTPYVYADIYERPKGGFLPEKHV